MKSILKKQHKLAILRIVAIYSFFGSLWIYLSDSILRLIVDDPAVMTQIAVFKGILFILITAMLLYALIYHRMEIIVGSEKLLRRSEERFKQIAENAGEIIWEVNKDGLYTYVNPVFETILGYKPEDIIDKKYIFDLIEPAQRDKYRLEMLNMFNNKHILKRYILTFMHQNGEKILLETNTAPIITSQGHLYGYRGDKIDITERKKTEAALIESEEKYRTLIDTSPDAILMLTVEGEITLANQQAVILYKYNNSSEMIGLNAQCLIPPEETEHIFRILGKVINTGKAIYDEYIFVKTTGERFFAGLNLSVVFDAENKPKAVIGVARDISDRKKTDLELEKYRAHLEELVDGRTKELAEVNNLLQDEIKKQRDAEEKVKLALEKEKELNALKSEFISTTSHEFRTPLATILSSTELNERYWEQRDKEKFLNHTDRVKKAINYLTGLMDDVLTISKTEAKKIRFNPKPADLINLCNLVIEEAKTLMSENQTITVDLKLGDGIFLIDEKLIKYILSNLLSNSIKFSADSGRIDFLARSEETEIIFEVKDNGIGIPEEDRIRIFEPFDRGSNIGLIRGTGLGMSIIKRSVELHGGSIGLESAIGMGTKFIITIPLKAYIN